MMSDEIAATTNAPAKLHWVPAAVSAVYLVLALLAALDAWGRRRSE
jgi:hypothetical protein